MVIKKVPKYYNKYTKNEEKMLWDYGGYIPLTNEEAIELTYFLAGIYGHGTFNLNLRFRKNSRGSCTRYNDGQYRIRLPYYPELHQVLHEIAHLVQFTENGDSKHNKKLMTIVQELYQHCLWSNLVKVILYKRMAELDWNLPTRKYLMKVARKLGLNGVAFELLATNAFPVSKKAEESR